MGQCSKTFRIRSLRVEDRAVARSSKQPPASSALISPLNELQDLVLVILGKVKIVQNYL